MKIFLRTLVASLFFLSPGLSFSASTDTLLTLELPATDASEAMMLTVSYGPGEFSMPHRHDAHTFVYVLEGNIEMQVEGGELMRLGPGDTFYENPDDIHMVSRNVSETNSAKFLVFFIKNPGAPITVPVQGAAAHH